MRLLNLRKVAMIFACLATTMFVSCGSDDDDNNVEPQLSVSPNTPITFTKDGGASEAKTITVTTNQSSWDAQSNQTWCTVTKGTNQFTVTATANTTINERKATITISAGKAVNVTIEITQAGVEPQLSVSPNTPITFTKDGGASEAKTIAVTTNQPSWDAQSNQTWCTVTKGADQFTVTATANTTINERKATITISAGKAVNVTIEITQAGVEPQLSVSPNTPITFTKDGGASEAKTIAVTTNQPSWDAQSNQTWCTVTKGTNQFTVTATANTTINERKATITISAGNAANVTIEITQAGVEPQLSVSPNTPITFTKDGGVSEAKTIAVTTNQPSWNATSNQTWCTVTKGTNQFTVTATANTTINERKATITVSAGNAANVTIEITQAGVEPQLSVSPNTPIMFTRVGASETKTITVTTNQPSWDATSNQTWCTVTKGTNQFTITATANTGVTRSATITVTAGNAPNVTLSVTQVSGGASIIVSRSRCKECYSSSYSSIRVESMDQGGTTYSIPPYDGANSVVVAPGTYRVLGSYSECETDGSMCSESTFMSPNFTVYAGDAKYISIVRGSIVSIQ